MKLQKGHKMDQDNQKIDKNQIKTKESKNLKGSKILEALKARKKAPLTSEQKESSFPSNAKQSFKTDSQTSTDKNSQEAASLVSPKEDSTFQPEWFEKFQESKQEYLYLKAEFENYKRRVLKEKQQLLLYDGERFISALANEVLDDLDRALIASHKFKSLEDLQKGLNMIHKKLSSLFKKFDIEVVDPKGKAFDPSYQEALSYLEKEDLPEDQVIETFKKAYKLHDKVIRPAQVVVSKKK